MSVKIIKKHVTTHGVIAAVSQKSFSFGSTNETLITIMIHHCLTLRSEKSCSRADGIVNCAGASFNMLVTRLQQAKNVIVSYARVSRRDLFRSSNRQSLNHKNTISTCCVRYKAFAQTITSRYMNLWSYWRRKLLFVWTLFWLWTTTMYCHYRLDCLCFIR